MAKLTKSQMLDMLSSSTGSSKKEAANWLNCLVNLAYKQVKSAGEFVIPGLGKLVKVNRPARMGRNPATGQQIKIAAKTVVKFRVAKQAKDAVL